MKKPRIFIVFMPKGLWPLQWISRVGLDDTGQWFGKDSHLALGDVEPVRRQSVYDKPVKWKITVEKL